jgi:hypothetical protein
MHAFSRFTALFVVPVLLATSRAWSADPPPPVEVNTCGQVIEGDGILMADLDCSGRRGLLEQGLRRHRCEQAAQAQGYDDLRHQRSRR